MATVSPCYLCDRPTQVTEPQGPIICKDCGEEHPFLTSGLRADANQEYTPETAQVLGEGVGWYSISGFDPFVNDSENTPQKTWASSSITEAPEPEVVLESLESQIREFGVEKTLTYLLAHSIIGEHTADLGYTSRDDTGLTAQLFRFAVGFVTGIDGTDRSTSLVSGGIELADEFPTQYRDIVQTLRQVMVAFGSEKYLQTEVGVDVDEEDQELLKVARAVQNRELIVSRPSFYGQYLEAMDRQYPPFQQEFFRHLDIDITSSVHWARAVVNKLEDRHKQLVLQIIKYRNSCLRMLGGYKRSYEQDSAKTAAEYVETEEYNNLRRTAISNWNVVVETIRENFWVQSDELQKMADAPSSLYFRQFREMLTTKVGETSLESPFEHNPLDESPILKIDEHYFLPRLPRLTYALSQCFYYKLLEKEKEFDRDFGNAWGNVIENWTVIRLSQILSEKQFAHSVEYVTSDGKEGEIDVLARVGDTVLVIEVKAKRLSVQARAGALQQIKKDTKDKGIGKAISQVNDAIEALKRVEDCTQIHQRVPFDLNPEEIERYEPMVVTATHYDQLATRNFPILFEEYSGNKLPYVCSVYDLDAMAEVLDDSELMDYVKIRRGELRKRRALAAGDELDFLEAYKANRLAHSALPLPSLEESEKANVKITRNISNLDAGVRRKVAEKYGLMVRYPTDEY